MASRTPSVWAKIDARDLAHLMLDSILMDQTAQYLRRGRSLLKIEADELGRRWITAFRAWASDRRQHRRALGDLGAELRLRGIEPPYETVRPELDAVRDRLNKDRDWRAPGIRATIRKFLKDVNLPQA